VTIPLQHPGVYARIGLHLALQEQMPSELHEKPTDRLLQSEGFPLHWSSSIEKLDTLMLGGCYGVTCIASEGKVGKSTLAMASAIQAAATLDRQVIYFNAELSLTEFDDRMRRYLNAHPACADAEQMLHVYHAGRGITPEEIALRCDEHASQEPLIVVLDSINTLASLRGGSYYVALEALSMWAMLARRYSDGAASFLIVAETNKLGGIKGERLQFWADAIIRLKEPENRAWVEIEVTHSRRTPAGPVGKYLRHTPSMSFREAGTEEIPKPRAIGDEGETWWNR
jgi:predicted ATP-dependent serine protease